MECIYWTCLFQGGEMYIFFEEYDQEETDINRSDWFLQFIFSGVYFSLT